MKWGKSDEDVRYNRASVRAEVVQMGREELIQKPLWRTSKFPGGSSENRGFETECWQKQMIGKLQSFWPVTCSTAAPAWQWAFWLSAERSDYILKTWPQFIPSKDPWDTAVNQQTGHQGSLDILKMCFRYLGKSVDTFFQGPYRTGTTCGQRDVSGTASTHGTILFGSPGQSMMSLSLFCCLTWRWGKLETSGRWELQTDNQTCWEPENQ